MHFTFTRLQLPQRHEVGRLSDPPEYLCQLRAEELLVLDGEHLADLERGPAHAAQRGHDARRVGLGQQHRGGFCQGQSIRELNKKSQHFQSLHLRYRKNAMQVASHFVIRYRYYCWWHLLRLRSNIG